MEDFKFEESKLQKYEGPEYEAQLKRMKKM